MTTRPVHSTTSRNEDSVQASLAELRNLEIARLQAERIAAEDKKRAEEARAVEAERQRRAEIELAEQRRVAAEIEREERRMAAESELELAKERARLDSEARVEEKRLELDIKNSELALLQARQATPQRRRSHGLALCLAFVLMAVQGAMLWMHVNADRSTQLAATIDRLGRENDAMKDTLRAMDEATHAAKTEAAELHARLGAIETAAGKSAPVSNPGSSDSKRPGSSTASGKHNPKPAPPKSTPIIISDECLNSPLCGTNHR